jgi:acetolactate synthase-1/2/3 large subunit
VIQKLCEMTKGEAIITTGVGQHQMWAGQFYNFTKPRTFLTSGGLGAMGFGYPTALGAKVACPNKQVIDIDGDGSFLMNVQELATAKVEKIHAKVIILNNQHLGMVVQWEDRFLQEQPRPHLPRRSLRPRGHLSRLPDDLQGLRHHLRAGAAQEGPRRRAAAADRRGGSYALDVMVPYTEHVLPMIPAGTTPSRTSSRIR